VVDVVDDVVVDELVVVDEVDDVVVVGRAVAGGPEHDPRMLVKSATTFGGIPGPQSTWAVPAETTSQTPPL
jgi:hypothetical protein